MHKEAYYELGNVYYSKSMLDETIVCFKIQIEINPSHSNVFNMLGNVYYSKLEYDDAIISYL